jgi:hypothetical protein
VHPVQGKFRVTLPEGKYTVKCQGQEQHLVCLPTGVFHLDLRTGRALDFEISTIRNKGGEVRIGLRARGQGKHSFSLRGDNLTTDDPRKELSLKRGSVGAVEWSGRINSVDSPWFAVVVADENLENRKELNNFNDELGN